MNSHLAVTVIARRTSRPTHLPQSFGASVNFQRRTTLSILRSYSSFKLSTFNFSTARNMSSDKDSFRLEGFPDVPIKLPPDVEGNKLQEFYPFVNWLKTLQNSLRKQNTPGHPFADKPYELRSVHVESCTTFGSGKIGFAKISADVRNSDDETLPGTVFVRGPSVGMLVILIPSDDEQQAEAGQKGMWHKGQDDPCRDLESKARLKERYVVLTVQPRVAAGSLAFAELPAGMVDENNEFAGAAAKELKEELGLVVKKDEMICLTDLAVPRDGAYAEAGVKGHEEGVEMKKKVDAQSEPHLPLGMFPSAGGCDEYIKLFLCQKAVPRRSLEDWKGKQTGLREQGEKITLKLVKYADLWKEGARDAKVLGAIALFEGLKRESKI